MLLAAVVLHLHQYTEYPRPHIYLLRVFLPHLHYTGVLGALLDFAGRSEGGCGHMCHGTCC